MCLPHLPLILSLLQLLTFAQLADLFARLAVQAVCAASAVFPPQAGSAGTALLPPLLLKAEGAVRGSGERRQKEKPRLLVFGLDVFAQRRRLLQELRLREGRLDLLAIRGERVHVPGRGTRPRSGFGHGGCLVLRLLSGMV